MTNSNSNIKMISKLMFRLLPYQILLSAVGSVNGIVSSYFASNYVGISAMSAVGLYSPVSMLVGAVSTMLMGGAVILCGKYMGQNQQQKLQDMFSLDIVVSVLLGAVFTVLFLVMGAFDLTAFFTGDPEVRPLFNRYLIGQAVGIVPHMLAGQLSAFLSMENKASRATIASVVYIIVNLALNFLFVQVLRLETLGLALAASLGMWVFMGVQAQYFVAGSSHLKFKLRRLPWRQTGAIVLIGVPGALTNGYQTLRGLIVNWLLTSFVGSVGISAFATANNLMNIFWAIPAGMLAVSRILFSVSLGEEDRQTLTDIMRVMIRRFIPLMCVVSAGIILCAEPLTRIFYRDPSEPVFQMTAWGVRILPLCMPLAIFTMHFTCYGQASGKQGLVHVLSIVDGVICVAGFSAMLIRAMGVNSVYTANVLNGVVSCLVVLFYSMLKLRRFPRNMDELMVIPEDFGASPSDRLDLSVRSIGEVVSIAEQVQHFCLEHGIDQRRAFLAGLSLEEMAGNIVDHGFTKDKKTHSVDVRVVHKGDNVILRIKDDCVPFDPGERQKLAENEDITKNIGIRMVFRIATDVQYQNILGLNVLTVRI